MTRAESLEPRAETTGRDPTSISDFGLAISDLKGSESGQSLPAPRARQAGAIRNPQSEMERGWDPAKNAESRAASQEP
jgi:hypothetical protein